MNWMNSPELTSYTNWIHELSIPGSISPNRSAGQEVCRRRGSCRSSRRGRAVLSSTTACTAPRTRWRSSRARCRSGPSFLASFEARLRVCVRVSALRLLCVSALRGCLGREIKPHSVLRPLRTPGRARAGAVARVPFGRCHIHALRATWTSASRFGSVRGERQARVPPALLRVCACVRVCGLMLSSVYFVDCACGCARYIVFLYVCFMCVY